MGHAAREAVAVRVRQRVALPRRQVLHQAVQPHLRLQIGRVDRREVRLLLHVRWEVGGAALAGRRVGAGDVIVGGDEGRGKREKTVGNERQQEAAESGVLHHSGGRAVAGLLETICQRGHCKATGTESRTCPVSSHARARESCVYPPRFRMLRLRAGQALVDVE